MINGGYGIKNPTFEAPKAPDTPDVDGKIELRGQLRLTFSKTLK